MEFESVEQAAKRLQVTTRTVQKWAKDGKIPGASQMGRTWLIPAGFVSPVNALRSFDEEAMTVTDGPIASSAEKEAAAMVGMQGNFSMFQAVFAPGKCLEYVESLPQGAWQDVAEAQYHYFCGRFSLAAKLAEAYLEDRNLRLALSAGVVYCFANLGAGKAHLFYAGQEYVKKHVTQALRMSMEPQVQAYAVLILTMSHVLLHIPCPPMPPLEREIRHLPEGIRCYAAYLMANEAYLEKDYGRACGIAEMALAMCGDTYVILAIYLHLIYSIALMNRRHIVEAKNQFEKAWQLAREDGFLAVFGEHTGLLQGLLEVNLKKQYPDEYGQILRSAASFGEGWRKVHNAGAKRTVADQLTAVETAVASLFQRGWAVKEIASYMDISPRMVRHHISVVYEKLGITHREELAQHLFF